MMTLTTREIAQIIDYLEEIDAVIDADDGTAIPLPLLVKHERIKEIFE